MAWSAARMEGLPVAKPIYQMMAAVDNVVENAIRNNTLGQGSPYFGWTVEKFQAQRQQHQSASRAPLGHKPATHCKKGHLFNTANTGASGKGRYCKQCARDYSKRYEEDRKARGHFDKERGYVQPNSQLRDSATHLEEPR